VVSSLLARIYLAIPALLLLVAVACGTAAEPTQAPGATAPPAGQTPAPSNGTTPAGTINVGQKETGIFDGHPRLAVNPGLFVSQTAPVGEGLMHPDVNAQIQPWLAESWSISDDFLTWTFKLREGVQFHKGYGEMTAEDVVYSYVEGWSENSVHVRYGDFNTFWKGEGGGTVATGRYTVEVNTGHPLASAVVLQNWMAQAPGGSANWVISKQQSEEMGAEAASKQPALTGSWEFVESRPAQYWRMKAVEDHWRQTPAFGELVFWEIPEDSSRIAGFQTGNLDTFLMAFDTIPLVESIPGAQFVSVPGGLDYGLHFYGNYILQAEMGDPPAAYDPNLPWVSSTSDLNSPEWAQARMVREALSIAIDRETIIDTMLMGFGRPIPLMFWSNHEHQLEGRQWTYDPDRSKQLLEEAGYPNGFRITLTPALRAAPAEVEACEAVANMWHAIGIDVRFQSVPYETLRPQIVGRNYQGATCHAVGARVVTVGAQPQLTLAGSFNYGAQHQFLEEIMPQIEAAIDPAELDQLEGELGKFLFDHSLTYLGLYAVDVVWPVGSRLHPWTEHVKTADMRNINGYEFMRPQQ
jgi:peptide/nickel transport system substrate-binding protein